MIGGAQKLIIDMLTYADINRFDYELITLFTFKDRKTFYDKIPKYIPVHRLEWTSIWNISGWINTVRILKKIKPDVVISHLFFSNTVVRIIKLFIGYKVITVEHNTYTRKTRFQILVDKMLSFVTFKIIAVSNTVKEFTSQQENISENKFEVIKNGIDMKTIVNFLDSSNKLDLKRSLGFNDSDKIILNVARLTDQKNHTLLIEGFSEFVSKYPGYKLVILGEGVQKENLISKINKCCINDRVFLMGARDDVFKFYVVSDFLVSTSKIEGLSIAYLESLSFGLPIVATNTAGTDELIKDGYNGYFIKESTVIEVVNSLVKMKESDLVLMKNNAIDSSLQYDVRQTIKAYESLY